MTDYGCGEQCAAVELGRMVALEDSVGLMLAHDITEIVPGASKGPAFKKGYVVTKEDLPHLRRLGKRHLYVLEVAAHLYHEDQAAELMFQSLCGPGVEQVGPPAEGKINFKARHDGIFYLDKERLIEFNMVPDVTCSAIHRYTPVKKGDILAGTRAIPLLVDKNYVHQACEVAEKNGGLLQVRPYRPLKAGIVVTGNEVYEGIIEDKFADIVSQKLKELGAETVGSALCPDDRRVVAQTITDLVGQGAEIIITTAGMSVDPDDVTRMGIADAGGRNLIYGTPVLPGAMFLVGDLVSHGRKLPILGVPACALFYKTTILDLILPRVLTGEHFDRAKIAELSHGGFCRNCAGGCRYPLCGFGRGS
ncbi:molybdopterin-binding protein [Dethiosulfatarculus sandiegensis]|uniref:molybdopterin-binding protein n=1 Tax=Dethiosulfatarculus sandiegensis TaxID=1429043 RepID=UPI000696690F|nr:molybdopterin-binding protein [Dethiosulfatarculus sandiegensis]